MHWDHVERCSCWRDTYSETELGKEIKRPCVLIQSVLSKLVTVSLLTVKNGRGLLKVFVLKRELTVLQKLWSVWCYVVVSASFSGRLLDGVCIF